ncbi:hypothetical protein COLO4_29062 [Corchorus olitorius]|uniref:RNase H type-1 domain-containing protein n=1 Tax=Corchorus olitorius TaxID=93759 RepID=A0A1R3HGI8_9ROSI|nr:hypothetical protein COLO4_29062 [Corchorus olitorius]
MGTVADKIQKESQKWEPPEEGWYKMNCDGAYKEGSDEGGLGIIVRDNEARVIAGMNKVVRSSSCLMTECYAVLNITGSEKCNWEISPIIDDIKALLESFEDSKIGWVAHEANQAADWLAQQSRRRKLAEATQIVKEFNGFDLAVQNCLINANIQWGNLAEARKLFDEMPERNEVTWTTLISGLMKHGRVQESMWYFERNPFKDVVSWTAGISGILSSLASLKVLRAGRTIHAHVKKIGIEEDVFISSSLVDLYCKCGETKDGRLVFDSIEKKNVVSWNSIISGYCTNGLMDEAKDLFDNMPTRDNISWGSIIGGYLECKEFDKVFEAFNEMLLSGKVPTRLTFSSVLCACANVASLEKGKDLHGKIIKVGFQYDVFLGTALTDMYAKSGDIESSKQVFDRMQERNEITWTVMIQGLAESGFAKESLALFEEMIRSSSIAPNELMLLSVLFACSHSGLVDEGLQFFGAMETVYGIRPKGRHYTCIVDMLSRAGRLYEAEEFINSMPIQPEANALAALLSGCKTYKNEEIAERTARKLGKLAEKSSAGFVLLSNIYASAGRWIDVSNIRKLMREKGLKKSGGCSWVEVRNNLHSFYSKDGTHSKSAEIYDILELLRSEMLAPFPDLLK